MGKRDPRIDAYIEKSADFARPILEHLRAVVHEACPDVEETMKWSFPHFMHHGICAAWPASSSIARSVSGRPDKWPGWREIRKRRWGISDALPR